MNRRLSSLCVFCGSKVGTDPNYVSAAKRLAKEMVNREIELVYGAGSIGIMGVMADEVLRLGGRVTGVIPKFLQDFEVGHKGLSRLIVTENMHERKKTMFDLSDGFITLPGGLGTLDETFEILTWKQLRLHEKPIVILDSGGYWSGLEALIGNVIEKDFAHEKVRDLYRIVQSPEDIFKALSEMPAVNEQVLSSHF